MNQESNKKEYSVDQFIAKLEQAVTFICSRVINRSEVVEQAVCALLTSEHLLLQSRTGVGKSLLTEQLFTVFEGANIFRVQASKEQQPDTYFGGLDIELLKTGKIFHNTEGSLVESEFGFIDEIFDANDFTLRALLSLLNERRLIRGVQHVQAKIHTVIAATNYLRISEVTEAILDRFLYKAIVLPDKEPYLQYKISQQYLKHSGNTIENVQKIHFNELKYMSNIVRGNNNERTISIEPKILYFANLVIRHYEFLKNKTIREANRGKNSHEIDEYYISPRTQAKSIDLLRAIALLHGRTSVVFEDVFKLYFIFSTVGLPEEVALFYKSYNTMYASLSTGSGFKQIETLLEFDNLLQSIAENPSMLHQPISTFLDTPLTRTLVEWFKEKFTNLDETVQNNRRILEGFIKNFVPATDEIRELRNTLDHQLQVILSKIQH